MKRLPGILLLSLLISGCYGDPSAVTGGGDTDRYATQVMEYKPAPGQFVNNYGDSGDALGAPDGSVVTLGGFGGSITLRLSTPVTDIPGEADFVIWGNAFYIGGETRSRWAEPGLIEVSPDNATWYLIGGSLFHSGNPPSANLRTAAYSNTNSSSWPAWLAGSGTWSTANFCLNSAFTNRIDPADNNYTNAASDTMETLYGYADCTPKGTINSGWSADDPCSFGIETSGGDPVMLEWAVDSSGIPIYSSISNLSFRYIRITTAVLLDGGLLGEFSTEIDAIGICR